MGAGGERLVWIRRWVVVGLAVLIVRLLVLQVWQGSRYRALAEKNRLRTVPQSAPRGLILDRHGRQLAGNQISFQLAAIPQDLPPIRPRPSGSAPSGGLPLGVIDFQGVFERLGSLVGEPPIYLERRFDHAQFLPFQPTPILTPISKEVALRVEEARLRLPGVVVERVVTRFYPLGASASSLLGYVGLPSADEFPRLKTYGVRSHDVVGRAGLERELDDLLRGQSGGSLIEVNHRGRQVRVVGHREPVAGATVVLTLDAELQALIERELVQQHQTGAAVVLAPKTGEVLAMVSVPQADPNVFAAQDAAAILQLLSDPQAPLMNRATAGMYLPGSIIKTMTATTALEHRVVTPSTTVFCPGSLAIGNRRFHCWKRDGHGSLTMREALTVSCNVYFMEVGRRLGLERLRSGLLQAGVGRPTGWFLDEQAGHLPSGRKLSEGDVALLAIGQGQILVTPLQAALVASALANGGWVKEPWVVARAGVRPSPRPTTHQRGWSASSLSVVREGMIAVVNDPGGTGGVARSERIRIAGKTGTAQTHVPGKTHGWFIGFCPAEEPVAALAIVAEYGGSGGELPAFLGKLVCEYLLDHPPQGGS